MDVPSFLLGRIKGSGGAGVNYIVVDELPTTGEEGIIYLVPKEDTQTDNVYNEYMYIEDEWELIGDTQADISNKQDIMQFTSLPTPNVDLLGKIYQYIGTTDSTYTNGYYYKCVSDGENPATYSWSNINVQNSEAPRYIEDGNGARMYIIKYSTDTTYQNNVMKPVFNEVRKHSNYSVFIDDNREINIANWDNWNGTNFTGIYKNQHIGSSNTLICMTPLVIFRNDDLVSQLMKRKNQIILGVVNDQVSSFSFNTSLTYGASYIGTSATYNRTFIPAQPYHPANKKYVDDTTLLKAYQLAGLSAYSSSSTYAVGDYIYYNNLIYKCSTAVETAEAFDDTKWTQKTYMEYMSDTLVGTALGGSY